ncbi:MAG: hypothetical protein FJ100_05135 [Deltaproteobacteria bacterium]|nr:hypothetical protein [Deltaproteobacteria bacterium]
MVQGRRCNRWGAWVLCAAAAIGCEKAAAGIDAGPDPPADSQTAGPDGQPGDIPNTKPTTRVGGADPEGKGWLDWSTGKDTPEILKGPQGGQHIWVSARTANLHPKKARITVTMFLETPTGDQVVKPGTVEMTGTLKWEEGWLVYAGLPAFVKEPCVIRDKKVRVELAVDDLYGVHAADTAWITPVWKGYCEGDP